MDADALAKVIESFSSLLWPIMVIIFFVAFRKAVEEVIRSARNRKFTIEVAGQKLSMEEASEQQRQLIADLQAQIAEIRKSPGGAALADTRQVSESDVQAEAVPPQPPLKLRSLLWVDDTPRNNSYFIEELERLGVRVDLAETTSEALELLQATRYSAVVSDMARSFAPKAGLELLRAVRKLDPALPFFIYCGARSVRNYRDEALSLGATGITASASELYAMLNLEQLRKEA
jgi:CheY-like chemotaxis protein